MSDILDFGAKPPTPAMPSAPQPVASPGVDEKQLRDFYDPDGLRDAIYERALSAASALPPLQNQKHILRLSNVRYVDPPTVSKRQHKEAILARSSLYRRMKGTWELYDAPTGKLIESRDQIVGGVPIVAPTGTFVDNGTEYTLQNQPRLDAGLYSRRKNNGELEVYAAIMPGKGVAHRYMMDPAKGVFKMGIQASEIPLVPLLHTLGATPDEISNAWGPQIYKDNVAAAHSSLALKKFKAKLLKAQDLVGDEETVTKRLVEAVSKMELNPFVTKRTLGKEYKNLSKEAILDATAKLLKIHRGEADVDDRDSLAYQTFHGPEDLISERIAKDHSGLRRAAFWKVSNAGTLSAMPSGVMTKQVRQALLGSGLGLNLEEINPVEILDKFGKLTKLGEGGIPSLDSVPEECYDEQTEVFTRNGWKYWREITASDELACQQDGRLEFHRPLRLIRKFYEGELYGIKTRILDLLVTPGHRHWCRKYRNTKRAQAAYGFELAREGFRRPRQFQLKTKPWLGTITDGKFHLPSVLGERKSYVFDLVDFAEFLGWYIAEGCSDSYAFRVKGQYVMSISQDKEANPANVASIDRLLRRMGLNFSYQGHNFIFCGKQLWYWLHTHCGRLSGEKRIPAVCFEWPVAARKRLLLSYGLGDGSATACGRVCYTTNSPQLADDLIRLCCSLGLPAKHCKPDDRQPEKYSRRYSVSLLTSKECGVTSKKLYATGYYRTKYSGIVYCAEVPGELLLVRRNGSVPVWSGNSRNVQASHYPFIDRVRTPESSRSGIDLYMARSARKGKDGKLYTKVLNVKTNQYEWKTPQELADSVVTYAGELRTPNQYVVANNRGRLDNVDRSEVQYDVPHYEDTYSPLANLVPGKSGVKAQRMAMASRMFTQALSLKNGQAPLVRAGVAGSNGTQDYDTLYGKFAGAIRAKQGGQVLGIKDGVMTVQYDDGTKATIEAYEHHPFNRKSYLHQEFVAKPGQRFESNQLLAKSNFTDNNGAIALGLNARTAYMPWKGLNFEDAAVVSQSFANRATSQHIYQHDLDIGDNVKASKRDYMAVFGGKFKRDMFDRFDDNGMIKKGQTVHYGEPLILATKTVEPMENKILKRGAKQTVDAAVTWDHHTPGVITDVAMGKNGPVVMVKTEAPMQVGDKLSGRFGDKGVLAAVIPDDQMPQDAQGRPFEVLVNPLGIATRTNPAQKAELFLGKIAEYTGKPELIQDFEDIEDLVDYASKRLQAHGLPEMEDLIDPSTGKRIPGVPTGNRYFMKLHHMSFDKNQGRGGGSYSSEDTPTKGGEGGAKRVSGLDTAALLAHGALNTLEDVSLVRGQSNPDYWLRFMQGYNPATPKIPEVYHKFVQTLRGAGVNLVPDGPKTKFMPMTRKDVAELIGDRWLENGETARFDQNMEPVTGGLFDPKITGGHAGTLWSGIKLDEPILNPIMEEPARRILGLKQKELQGVIEGSFTLPKYGTGPLALAQALDAVDIDKELALAREQIKSGTKVKRDAAIRRLSYLKAAEKTGIHPGEWMLDAIPVLPPKIRPVSLMGDSGVPLIANPNYLYREIFQAQKALREVKKRFGDEGAKNERATLYNAYKALVGLAEPVHPKLQEKRVEGLLKSVFGNSPKYGMVQRKLISHPVDNVGRAAITPDPEMDMDTVGIPERTAFSVYERFLVRRLVRKGMPFTQAMRQVRDKTDLARATLLEEMDSRPVFINRAPVLHKFGVMAFRPKLVSDETMHISPLVVSGFNADFDGDAMQFHVPSTEAAVKEAYERLLPSKSLISPADFSSPVHAPKNEYIGGLWYASSQRSKRHPRVFESLKAMLQARQRGELSMTDPVTILGK